MEFENATIVTSFVSKKINNARMDIWDSAGQERFQSLVQMYFRGTDMAFVVFTASDENSFEKAKEWVELVREKTQGTDPVIVVVENKIDVGQNAQQNEQQLYCQENNLLYQRCSAKTGDGIAELFALAEQKAALIGKVEKVPEVVVAPNKGCC